MKLQIYGYSLLLCFMCGVESSPQAVVNGSGYSITISGSKDYEQNGSGRSIADLTIPAGKTGFLNTQGSKSAKPGTIRSDKTGSMLGQTNNPIINKGKQLCVSGGSNYPQNWGDACNNVKAEGITASSPQTPYK